MMYRNYLIREEDGLWEAVSAKDGWEADWSLILTMRSEAGIKLLIDYREDEREIYESLR